MSRLHICNTFFEAELEQATKKSLSDWFRSHPVFLQLQFLPLLYAAPDDKILVTDLPSDPDPRLCLLNHPPAGYPIEHWGPSQAIAKWADQHNIPYTLPDWEMIRTINSKVFSFTHSPKLPGAEILHTPEEVTAWLAKTPGPKVLKTPFGTAGRGHYHIPAQTPNVKPQYKAPSDEASFGDPSSNVKLQYKAPKNEAFFGDPSSNVKLLYMGQLIGEPWVERVLDFSTQWEKGKLLGVTVFENEPNGTYRGTYAGDVEKWALEEHLAIAQPLIEKIQQMGYSGHVGIDAFIYLWEGKKRVHPVVEINARKTMSWVALQMPQRQLYYARSKEGLLPTQLRNKIFSRNLL